MAARRTSDTRAEGFEATYTRAVPIVLMMARGELAEPVPEPHLVEGVDAAGLQPIAAEGALKAGVALQQRDLHPAPG
jgi:hypothetical protein